MLIGALKRRRAKGRKTKQKRERGFDGEGLRDRDRRGAVRSFVVLFVVLDPCLRSGMILSYILAFLPDSVSRSLWDECRMCAESMILHHAIAFHDNLLQSYVCKDCK